ncbi:MFS transporter [Ancylomarina longa]|uniref:MFS transporter n=1 Tax=Ancylomarina longa TaxID=2487017 RepID=A0A434AG36_9BACT|nr:MFS transporter [Ancylomarina longa]RUT73275.1 MFS transporter [Ancylomarina longa]
MKNSKWGVKLSLIVNYFVFAILLNSVGAVILQVQRNFDITKAGASVLEGFKDLPIAIASFLLASFLPKLGYKKSMLIGLALVSIACLFMQFADEFWYFKILFFIVGVSFALIKVTVFATIGLVTDSPKEHSSFMSLLEGFFMVGVLLGNVLFSLFIIDGEPKSSYWLNVYWILAGLSIIAFLLLFFTKLDETGAVKKEKTLASDFSDMLKMIIRPLVVFFILGVFFYVLIEQSFQTWTPTFYQNILKLPASMGIQAGAILAGALALGRFSAGLALKKFHWLYVVSFCLLICASIVLVVLPLTKGIVVVENVSWLRAPFVAYLFPLMGMFLSPIYPIINSVVLSALPKHLQSSMSGLIVVFSALGGTTGSIITGNVFGHFDGQTAFYLTLIPMTLLLLILIRFNKQVKLNRSTVQK